MLYYIYFVLIFLHSTFHLKYAESTDAEFTYTDTIKRCSDLGTNWAEEKLNCSSFPTPVAGVAPEQQALCLSLVEISCVKKHRESQCTAGQDAAKSGQSCVPQVFKQGYEYFKDCCEACKMGLIIGSAGGPCDPKTFGPPWDVSFLACCRELIPSTTSTSTTTESTTIEPTSTVPIPTTTGKIKNKITPPTQPPLESLCDTLPGELCAHICVPTPSSYRCECRKGFTLMDDGKSCQQRDVADRCKTNNPCEHQCVDTGMAVRCICYPGYKLNPDKISCSDIDECKENIHKCDSMEICVNEPGTYDCVNENEKDYEYEKCPLGYTYNSDSNVCDDLDECKYDLDECEKGKVCENTVGSYTCVDADKVPKLNLNDDVECPPGYYFKTSIQSCADIDECSTGKDDCNRESQICLNTQGSFTCQNRASKTNCPAGFKINMIGLCVDIDECVENVEICSEKEECVNEEGGYRCVAKTNKSKRVPETTPMTTSSTTAPTTTPMTTIPTTPMTTPTTTPTVPPVVIYPRRPPQEPKGYPQYSPPLPSLCQEGFTYSLPLQRCVDVNECEEDHLACDSNQICKNTIGSFTCICKVGFQLDSVTGACIDVNECQTGAHNCIHSQRCDNTIGSFQCVRFTSCGTGYTLNAASGLCEDDDECALGTHDCNNLGANYQCRNTKGSYRCERIRCLTNSCIERRIITIPTHIFFPGMTTTTVIASNTPNSAPNITPSAVDKTPLTTVHLKQCLQGYIKNSKGYCDDINECDQNPCASHQRCINTQGSYYCYNLINCPPGFKISGDGKFCEDIDECETGTHKCMALQKCINREGFYICQCPPGYHTNKANQCEDINECNYRQMICGRNAECENTEGSYRCRCKEGFRQMNDGKMCDDVDECQEIPNLCQHTCINYWGGYKCACKPGYTLNVDNRTCTDINECEMFKEQQLCIGFCENVPGSYTCRCPEGYRLGSDGRTCQDIDECAKGNICPNFEDICWNIRGSYRCNSINCPHNYVLDSAQKNRCKRKTEYCDKRDSQCITQPSSYSYNFITFVSNLPLPDEGQLDLFTMRGPQWITTTTFNMELMNVRCPYGIPKADQNYFRMRRTNINEIVLSLRRIVQGPQEIELQLTMEVYHNGDYHGSVVAKLFIIVSQYEF